MAAYPFPDPHGNQTKWDQPEAATAAGVDASTQGATNSILRNVCLRKSNRIYRVINLNGNERSIPFSLSCFSFRLVKCYVCPSGVVDWFGFNFSPIRLTYRDFRNKRQSSPFPRILHFQDNNN